MKTLGSIEEIERKVSPYEVVSFDVFDTLLFRNVPEPKDVFAFAEELACSRGVDADGFAAKRVEAERRAGSRKAPGHDTTLDDIYGELAFDEGLKPALRQAELDSERQLLVPNGPMVALANRLKDGGRTVVATSDMYLPADFLRGVLAENGLVPDRLYVSCEVGLRKSRGELFGYVLGDLGVTPDKVVHIGDNRLSDGAMPARAGIASVLYGLAVPAPATGKPGRASELVMSSLVSRRSLAAGGPYGRVGYAFLGPLLVGMCQWIKAAHDERPSASLHFLSRDGYVVEKAYELLYPEEPCRYSYVSRRSLTVPLLTDARSFHDVIGTVPYIKREETVPALLEKLGLDDPDLCSRLEGEHGRDLSREDMLSGALDGLFDEIRGPMAENAAAEREAMDGYLAQEFGGECVLVDVGWYGTIQSCLEKALGRRATGLYLGLLRHDPDYALADARGYVYDYRAGDVFDSSLVFSFNGLVETFFSAPHGSVRRYERRDDGSYAPVFAAVEDENADALPQIHAGALRFVADYSQAVGPYALEAARPEYAYANMERLLTEPTDAEADLLGRLWFYDASYDRLVCLGPASEYLRSPKAMARDFLRSNWKAAWLRKVLHGAPLARAAYKAMMRAKGGK